MPSSTVLSTDAVLPAALNGGHRYPDRVDLGGRRPARECLLRQPLPPLGCGGVAAAARRRRDLQERPAAPGRCGPGGRRSAAVASAPWQEGAVPALPGPCSMTATCWCSTSPVACRCCPPGLAGPHRARPAEAAAGRRQPPPGAPPGPLHLGAAALRPPARHAGLAQRLAADGPLPQGLPGPAAAPASGSPLWQLQPGESLALTTPIGRHHHARLGTIWAAAPAAGPAGSAAPAGPQRAHPAAARPDGLAGGGDDRHWPPPPDPHPHRRSRRAAAGGSALCPWWLCPSRGPAGDGGYHLHAHRLQLPCPEGNLLALEAPLPDPLRADADG